ncbi:MAG: type II secretion system protein [Bdellovibrionota bacterium]
MQILNCPKNKNHMCVLKQSGFTILECILAVGILSAMLASLVALQSSIVYVAQDSMQKLRAVWTMRQATAQIDYLLEVGGFPAIAEKSQFTWTGDASFSALITRKDLNKLKPSQFLITALKFYNLANSNGNEHLNVEQSIGPMAQILDNIPVTQSPGAVENSSISGTANQSHFANVFINVSWMMGSESKSLSDGLFLIDNIAFANLKLPNLGGGKGSGSGSGSTN